MSLLFLLRQNKWRQAQHGSVIAVDNGGKRGWEGQQFSTPKAERPPGPPPRKGGGKSGGTKGGEKGMGLPGYCHVAGA